MNESTSLMASDAIAEYQATEAGLAALRERMAGVQYEVSTTKGMAAARADRAELRSLRTALEAQRKALKEPMLDYSRRLDSEAKRITAELLKLEDPIDAQIKKEEARKETERLAREVAERARIIEIMHQINTIKAYTQIAIQYRSADQVAELLTSIERMEIGPSFEEFRSEAIAAHEVVLRDVRDILARKVEHEAEMVALAQAKAEARAAAKVQAEAEAMAQARQQAEAQALAKERADFEAQRAKFEQSQAQAAKVAAPPAPATTETATGRPENGPRAIVEPDPIPTVPPPIAAPPGPFFSKGVTSAVPPDQAIQVEAMVVPWRPSDAEIVELLADHFLVSTTTALHWLRLIDFATLEPRCTAIDAMSTTTTTTTIPARRPDHG